MKKIIRTVFLVMAMALAVYALVACGISNNPKKTKDALEDKQYTVETIIGDNDLDAQAELDSMSDEMHITAGDLVAMLAAYKGGTDDMAQDFIYIYYFKDGSVANKFWDANKKQIEDLGATEYKDVEGFEIKKQGSVVYFGTKQAISDAM